MMKMVFALFMVTISSAANGQSQSDLFKLGQELAVRIARVVPRCKIALGEGEDFYRQMVQPGSSLADSLAQSKLVWDDAWPAGYDQDSCAFTERVFASDILLSQDKCHVTSGIEAAELLMHEGFHHLGIADEAKARKNARKLLQDAESQRCGDLLSLSLDHSQDREPSGYFAALAVDSKNYKVGFVIDAVNEAEARALAQSYCGSTDCKVVGVSDKSCVEALALLKSGQEQVFGRLGQDHQSYVSSLVHSVNDFANTVDSRPGSHITSGICPLSVAVLVNDTTRAYRRYQVSPRATYSALAASQDHRFLVGASGAITRYDAEQQAIKNCQGVSLWSPCRVVASVRGLKLRGSVMELDRCEWPYDCKGEMAKLDFFVDIKISAGDEALLFSYNRLYDAEVTRADVSAVTVGDVQVSSTLVGFSK